MRHDDEDDVRFGDVELTEGVAVSRTGAGKMVVLPVSLARLRPSQKDVVADLQAVAVEVQAAQERLARLVEEAREEGVSWGVIGFCVGATDRGAAKRWGP